MPQAIRRAAPSLLLLLALAMLSACPKQAAQPATSSTPAPAPPASATPPADVAERKTMAVVFGASENDPWTAALLAALGAELNINPLSKNGSADGLDTFGPFDCQLGEQPITLQLALCDLSSVADIAAQAKLGDLAKSWIEGLKPAAVWLDGDQLQLQCGGKLDSSLPIVFSGVEVRSDAFYDEGRAVCGVMRQHSLARAMGELFRRVDHPKEVALISDDSPLGLSRIKLVRELEKAMPFGVTFVTQEPVTSWDGLAKALRGLDSGIDGVLVVALGEKGSGIARSGKALPAGLLKGVKPPVLVYGPTALDNSGVLSLRIRPAAHAREALRLCGEILAGKAAAPLGVKIPDEMELYQSER